MKASVGKHSGHLYLYPQVLKLLSKPPHEENDAGHMNDIAADVVVTAVLDLGRGKIHGELPGQAAKPQYDERSLLILVDVCSGDPVGHILVPRLVGVVVVIGRIPARRFLRGNLLVDIGRIGMRGTSVWGSHGG